MLKKILACSVVSLFVLCGAVSFSLASDMGDAEMTIEVEGSKKPKPAIFPHKAHQEKLQDCGVCHHGMGEDGKQVPYVKDQPIGKCVDCHNSEKLAGKTKGKLKLDTVKGAFHGNCLECHKAEAKKDESKKDLKKCSTCHPKKK